MKLRKVKRTIRLNPVGTCANTRKENVSDRAQRYRANQAGCLPEGPRVCEYCGSRDEIMVHHRDGDESHTTRRNLGFACRSCNNRIGAAMAAAGKGRRTVQMNPGGAQNLGQWVIAVSVLNGSSDQMKLADAREMVRNTPAAKRSEFAREIWARRQRRGTAQWASTVPF
jgi:hypothetical protein